MENQDLVYYNAERFLQYFGSISDQSQALPLFFVALLLCLFAGSNCLNRQATQATSKLIRRIYN